MDRRPDMATSVICREASAGKFPEKPAGDLHKLGEPSVAWKSSKSHISGLVLDHVEGRIRDNCCDQAMTLDEVTSSSTTKLEMDPTVQRAREWLRRRGMSEQKSVEHAMEVDSTEGTRQGLSALEAVQSSDSAPQPMAETRTSMDPQNRPVLTEISMNCSQPSRSSPIGQTLPHRHNLSLNPPKSWSHDRNTLSDGRGPLNEEHCFSRLSAECSKAPNCTEASLTQEPMMESSGHGGRHQSRTPSPSSSHSRKVASRTVSEHSQLLTTREREANEDRLRARARAAGNSVPARRAVRSAQRRVNSSRKRWAGESPAFQGSDARAVRSDLFRRRDARIRQFLERELERSEASRLSPEMDRTSSEACGPDVSCRPQSVASCGDPESNSPADVDTPEDEPVSLSFLEAEAEVYAEELCTPSPPPQPCPLPTPLS
mmetsp:Transcript_77372/g.134206  ORF Transcript_77372/g.134206 Transcript_77372/m.134206 type:complete len:430 (+) Transcript_77372:2-1291(+)